jgi:hypothetical protein
MSVANEPCLRAQVFREVSATQRGGNKKARHLMGARAVRLVAWVLRAEANGVPR